MLHLLAGGYGRECRNILLITELPLFVINASSLAAAVASLAKLGNIRRHLAYQTTESQPVKPVTTKRRHKGYDPQTNELIATRNST